MNCSQLHLGRSTASWKATGPSSQTNLERTTTMVTESIRWTDSPEKLGMAESRWSEVRAWAIKLTAAPSL